MVNVQDDHPFGLVPPLRPSPSPSPPSGSQPWTPDGDYPEQSPSRINEEHHSEPILDVKLIKAPRSKTRRVDAFGRGRDRTKANGSPLVSNGDGIQDIDEPLKAATLSRPDDDLLSRLSDDVRNSLLDGFRLRDSGRVVQTWDDT
ncbi:hypothetical protein FRC04_006182 [Tulasnella sp. 424]|nr:hypothetical protein FRC04_006182 [Tulasnella sp. 424]